MAVTFSKHLSADWSSLPLDLLYLILGKLLEPTDQVRFAVVCKEWHALAKQYNHSTQRFRKVFPMLMIPTESQGRRKLYSISEGKVYNNFELPVHCNSYKRSCSSSHAPGWFAIVDLLGDDQLSVSLVNPFRKTVAPICMPPLDFKIGRYWFENFIPKVILSADPILNPNNYVVVAAYDRFQRFAFIKGGQSSWTYTNVQLFFTDVIFYRSQVYGVAQWGYIKSIDINSQPLINKILAPIGFPCHTIKAYLVETTKGDLLHVRRFLKENMGVRLGSVYHNYEDKEFWTESFKVYKLVFDESGESLVEQVELESIGDEALFVGDNHSMSVSASNFPGCQPNSIYFTDDLVELGGMRVRLVDDEQRITDNNGKDIRNLPSDMGIFNLEDGTITPHYYLHPYHKNFPSAIWILPHFNWPC